MLSFLFVLFWIGVCAMLGGAFKSDIRERTLISHCYLCNEPNAAPFGLYEIDAEIKELVGDFVPHHAPICKRCRDLIKDAASAAITHTQNK